MKNCLPAFGSFPGGLGLQQSRQFRKLLLEVRSVQAAEIRFQDFRAGRVHEQDAAL